MTKEYSISNERSVSVVYNEQGAAQVSKEVMEQCFIPLLSQFEKYKWHDLRKAPNDLPKEIDEVAYIGKDGRKYFTTGKTLEFYLSKCPVEKREIIAWKYEEPFERNDEE